MKKSFTPESRPLVIDISSETTIEARPKKTKMPVVKTAKLNVDSNVKPTVIKPNFSKPLVSQPTVSKPKKKKKVVNSNVPKNKEGIPIYKLTKNYKGK